MSFKRFAANSLHCLRIGLTSLALFQFSLGGPLASSAQAQSNDSNTTTPIKHVIVIIGENRSFDHVFATYVPKSGQKVWNLLSEGIVKADGTPGTNFAKAHQLAAVDLGEKTGGDPFLLTPPKIDFGGDVLPAPLVGGAKDSYIPSDSLTLAEASETGLPTNYYPFPAAPASPRILQTPASPTLMPSPQVLFS
jgi:phospholipase C